MPTGSITPSPLPGSRAERECLAAAATAVVADNGFEASSIELVVERAGLDRAAFHRHFTDLRDCCSQLLAGIIDDFNRLVFGAITRSGATCWRDRLRVAAYAAARFFRENPVKVRFSVTGILGAGEMVQVQREQHLNLMVDLVDGARQELDDPDSIGRAAAESTIGSVFGFLLKEVNEYGRVRSTKAIVPELMYLAVRPYFGEEVAREELSMPPPRTESRSGL